LEPRNSDAEDEMQFVSELLSLVCFETDIPLAPVMSVIGPRKAAPTVVQPRKLADHTYPSGLRLDVGRPLSAGRRLALALYRDGISSRSAYYQFLSLYKEGHHSIFCSPSHSLIPLPPPGSNIGNARGGQRCPPLACTMTALRGVGGGSTDATRAQLAPLRRDEQPVRVAGLRTIPLERARQIVHGLRRVAGDVVVRGCRAHVRRRRRRELERRVG
jgi:hypothetical protein